MQLQGSSCRKQSSCPGACTLASCGCPTPSPLTVSSRPLPNSFLCRNFSLGSRPAHHQQNREAANCNVATQRHRQRKGMGRSFQLGMVTLQECQNQLSTKHMEAEFASQSIINNLCCFTVYLLQSLEANHFPFLCWVLSCHCFDCPASLQLVYPETNIVFCGPPAVCFNKSLLKV